MPFDAGSQPSLTHHLTTLGITSTVPMHVLTAHKTQQMRRHRPNLFATPYPYLVVGGIAAAMNLLFVWRSIGSFSVVHALASIMALLSGPSAAIGLLILVLGCSEVVGVRSIRGKAQWVEKRFGLRHYRHVPQPIVDVINQVIWRPRVNLIYGELVQNRKILDPYVLVEIDGEQACLGIWENDHVIACAECGP